MSTPMPGGTQASLSALAACAHPCTTRISQTWRLVRKGLPESSAPSAFAAFAATHASTCGCRGVGASSSASDSGIPNARVSSSRGLRMHFLHSMLHSSGQTPRACALGDGLRHWSSTPRMRLDPPCLLCSPHPSWKACSASSLLLSMDHSVHVLNNHQAALARGSQVSTTTAQVIQSQNRCPGRRWRACNPSRARAVSEHMRLRGRAASPPPSERVCVCPG